MKAINLKSFIEIYEHNKLTHCINSREFNFCGNEIKIVDIKSLERFLLELESFKVSIENFSEFYFDYSIPQIGKEFDLLRFSDTSVLNIELKSEHTEKIQNQLIKNKHYLKFLNKQMYLYTYIAQDNTLWKLEDNNELKKCNFQEVIIILKEQTKNNIITDHPDKIFIPSNYLISPFNKTKEFMNGEYFLTNEQEEVEKKIEKNINDGHKYFLITGEAGSGKTLLTYSIAKKYINSGYNVSLIHVGNLNNGHIILCEDFKWNIYPIKNWNAIFETTPPDFVIIDEVQRMNNKSQFAEIISNISKNNSILIMSGDKKQTLNNNEGWAIDISNVTKFQLTGKIRTNKNLANFIKVLLDLKRKHHIKVLNQNIDISFFDCIQEARPYIKSKTNYSYISYTPNNGFYSPLCDAHNYNFSTIGTSHQVVGQEFENVITILDSHFYYDENDILKARKITHNPYSPLKMFFQQITRAINKVEIVVVENIELYNKIEQIFE